MSEIKRIWMVALTITGESNYINTETHMHVTERDARDHLAAFKLRCIKQGDSSVPSYSERVHGEIMKANPAYVQGVTGSTPDTIEYIPTGGIFNGTMESTTINPDNLEDAFKSYTVEVEIRRTYNMSVTIDEADSQDVAEELARERISDGDEEWRIDCPDDEEIDITDCYED